MIRSIPKAVYCLHFDDAKGDSCGIRGIRFVRLQIWKRRLSIPDDRAVSIACHFNLTRRWLQALNGRTTFLKVEQQEGIKDIKNPQRATYA